MKWWKRGDFLGKSEKLFIDERWYLITKDMLEIFYYLAGILMLISVILTLIQLNSAKKRLLKQENRSSKEKSLEILNAFSTIIIPAINKYKFTVRNENFPVVSDLFNEYFIVDMGTLSKEHLAIETTKQLNGLMGILNHLEYVSLIINLDLAEEEIVYETISTVYCNFIRDEYLSLSISRANDIPFTNVVNLYSQWNKKKKLHKINKAQAELDQAKKQLQEQR